MLRITVQNTGGAPTVHLDGRLVGEWAKELEQVWDRLSSTGQATRTTLDLSGISFVDADGKRLLAVMLSEGAKLQLEKPQPLVEFIMRGVQRGCRVYAVFKT